MEQDNSHGDAGGSTPSPNTPSCLVDQFPEVAAEWHPTRNGERSPSWVTPGSKYRAWWLCSVCGSEWQARVGSRTRGHGCPSCGRELAGRSHAVPETVTSPPTSLATPAIRRCGGAAETANMSGRFRSRTEVAEVPADGAPTAHWAHPSQGTHFLNGSHRSPRNGIPAATKQPLQPAPVTVPNAEFGGNAPTADRVVSRRLQQNQWRYRLSCMRKRIKPETARTSPTGGRPGWCFGAGRLRG
jgi:hypothetical protein